jgi:hypothetical protein
MTAPRISFRLTSIASGRARATLEDPPQTTNARRIEAELAGARSQCVEQRVETGDSVRAR